MIKLPSDWNQNKALLNPSEHEEEVEKSKTTIITNGESGAVFGTALFLIVLLGIFHTDDNGPLGVLIIGSSPIFSFLALLIYLSMTGKKMDWSYNGANSYSRGDISDPSGLDASSIWTTDNDWNNK